MLVSQCQDYDGRYRRLPKCQNIFVIIVIMFMIFSYIVIVHSTVIPFVKLTSLSTMNAQSECSRVVWVVRIEL